MTMICEHPKLITNPYTGQRLFVPCGCCHACHVCKQSTVSKRVKNEMLQHKYNIFFTLTYDNTHVPFIIPSRSGIFRNAYDPCLIDEFENVENLNISSNLLKDGRVFSNYVGVLYYKDIQNFLKKIRNDVVEKFGDSEISKINYKLRYVICGEYGTTTHRNHYHGIFHTNNEKFAKYLLSAIPSFWSFCDWQAISANDPDALPSYVESDKGASYVSKYCSKFDNCFEITKFKFFKPFVKYSKIPYYGLSAFDKEITKKIISGDSYELRKSVISESGELDVISISPYLQDFLFGKSVKYLYDFGERMVSCIVSNERNVPRAFRNFIERIRKHLSYFVGAITSSNVSFFLENLRKFVQRVKSLKLSDEMKEFERMSFFDYLKIKYQTFAPFHISKDLRDYLSFNFDECFHCCLDRVERLESLINPFLDKGISKMDILDLLCSSPYDAFKHDVIFSVNKHKSYLINKLL